MTNPKTVSLREIKVRSTRTTPLQNHIGPAKSVAVSKTQRGSPLGMCHGNMKQAAKLADRNSLVLEHLPLVKVIALNLRMRLPVYVELDDMVQAGTLGLFDAADKFDSDKQVSFDSYAKYRIKGAILDSLRQLDWASRDTRRRQKQVEAATSDLTAALRRAPTEAESAAKLGMDVERWRKMMLDLQTVGLVSASTRANEDDDLPAPDFPCKPDMHPDSICTREQLGRVLGEAMKTLPERHQKVVSLYHFRELSLANC